MIVNEKQIHTQKPKVTVSDLSAGDDTMNRDKKCSRKKGANSYL